MLTTLARSRAGRVWASTRPAVSTHTLRRIGVGTRTTPSCRRHSAAAPKRAAASWSWSTSVLARSAIVGGRRDLASYSAGASTVVLRANSGGGHLAAGVDVRVRSFFLVLIRSFLFGFRALVGQSLAAVLDCCCCCCCWCGCCLCIHRRNVLGRNAAQSAEAVGDRR